MEGIDAWAVFAGIVMVLSGLVLIVLGFFVWVAWIYGIPVFIIGIVILFTLRKQEEIEPIRKRSVKKTRGLKKK